MKYIAHRGYSKEAPENTLISFVEAKNNNFEYVECDLRFTKDRLAVLMHDESIDRTSNGSGLVSEMYFDELERYDFGSWKSDKYVGEGLLSFEGFVDYVASNNLAPYIELKGDMDLLEIKYLIDYIKDKDMLDKTSFISFEIDYLEKLIEIDSDIRIGFLCSLIEEDIDIYKGSSIYKNKNTFLNVYEKSIGFESLKLLDREVDIECWTVNDIKRLEELSKLGIKGITTDFINESLLK